MAPPPRPRKGAPAFFTGASAHQPVLENAVLAEVLPDHVDAWHAVFPGDRGLTFDGAVNDHIRDKGERMRYDRVLVRSLSLVDAARLGTTPGADGLFASDHFGLRVDVRMS